MTDLVQPLSAFMTRIAGPGELSGLSRLSGGANMESWAFDWAGAAYVLRRARRRTIGLTIDHRGLRVGAPPRASLHEVESLIRGRLHYVMPGEIGYTVLEPEEAPAPSKVTAAPAEGSWYGRLWSTVEVADGDPERGPDGAEVVIRPDAPR